MFREEVAKFIEDNLRLDDKELVATIRDKILLDFKPDLSSYEQIRYLKQSADRIHTAIADLSIEMVGWKNTPINIAEEMVYQAKKKK